MSGTRSGCDAIALHADRYQRVEEFADVVLGLWNTWDDGAVVIDPVVGLALLESRVGGFDLSHFDPDGPVPELRRRGLFRSEYDGRTLRHHLGTRPPPGFGRAAAERA